MSLQRILRQMRIENNQSEREKIDQSTPLAAIAQLQGNA